MKFARAAARYVQESRWHHSQQLTLQKDGSLIAEFRLPDTAEIKHWILSFGPRATVLEPAELVEEILQDLQQMIGNYRGIEECSRDEKQKNRLQISKLVVNAGNIEPQVQGVSSPVRNFDHVSSIAGQKNGSFS